MSLKFYGEYALQNMMSNIIFRESIPKQVDKKSRVPEEVKGVWGFQGGDRGLEFSRRRKGQFFFPTTFLILSHIKLFFFFFLSPELMITQQTTQFKLCTKETGVAQLSDSSRLHEL